VISVTRTGAPAGVDAGPGIEFRRGDVHDAALVDEIAALADVVVVSVRFSPTADGVRLIDAFPALTSACLTRRVRLGVVGGAASLLVSEGGPRLIDTPEFPDVAKTEAGNGALVLELLRDDSTGLDWFYLSPAQVFGSHSPGEALGKYRVGADVLVRDESGKSHISGADYALAFVDEIENPAHHGTRFTVAY
jgi:uncharacterized protein